jgi:hypothetical protein
LTSLILLMFIVVPTANADIKRKNKQKLPRGMTLTVIPLSNPEICECDWRADSLVFKSKPPDSLENYRDPPDLIDVKPPRRNIYILPGYDKRPFETMKAGEDLESKMDDGEINTGDAEANTTLSLNFNPGFRRRLHLHQFIARKPLQGQEDIIRWQCSCGMSIFFVTE